MDSLTTSAQINLNLLAQQRIALLAANQLNTMMGRPLTTDELKMASTSFQHNLPMALTIISNIIVRNPELFEATLIAEATDLADEAYYEINTGDQA